MSQQLINGKQQFIDGNGNPLAGGSVAFYAPGTLNPVNTWQDQALTVLNSNPVVLDANGMASIWGADETLYREVASTAGGIQLWDQVVGSLFGSSAPFPWVMTLAQINALSADQGPVVCSDEPGIYTWDGSAYTNAIAGFVYASQFISPAFNASQNDAGWAKLLLHVSATFGTSGCRVLVEPGTFLFGAATAIATGMTITGAGKTATTFSYNHTGDGVTAIYAINASRAANSRLERISIVNTNASNTGAGFDSVGGAYVYLDNCLFSGWKYGTIFDQTEVASNDRCEYKGNLTASIWLVNGADHTAGANTGYTNSISISRAQINEATTVAGIIDDGGSAHSFKDCDFNNCSTQMRIAGSNTYTVAACEMELAGAYSIELASTTSVLGTSVGKPSISISGTLFFAGSANTNINIVSAVSLSIINNTFSTSGANNLTGCANLITLFSQGNIGMGPAAFDAYAVYSVILDDPTAGLRMSQALIVNGEFGCNGKGPREPQTSGGTLAGVIAALVNIGILAS